ncbi:Crp/Fnr family transcriptional regulator [Chitinophaga pollutisoli]|uniref:Crp/Fnr family transcriptional regulator n=1 Tax=Chitinophaga pollutisoli TaxID=3133966 RepID=A0ABZ2YPL2_9BACT
MIIETDALAQNDLKVKFPVESVRDSDDIYHLMINGVTRKYRKKSIIYREGERSVSIYYVIKGRVKTSKWNVDGKELITGLYKVKDFLGNSAIITFGRYEETAEAMLDSELAVISIPDFEKMLLQIPFLANKLYSNQIVNMLDNQVRMMNIAYGTVRQKVINALLTFMEKYNTGRDSNFEIDVSRHNLAALAGVARESVIRTLSDLRDEGIIQIGESKIRITCIKRLVLECDFTKINSNR